MSQKQIQSEKTLAPTSKPNANRQAATPVSVKKNPSKKKFLTKKWQKILVIVLAVLLSLFIITGIVGAIFFNHYYKIARQVQTQGQVLAQAGRETMDALKAQNVPAAALSLEKTKAEYQTFKADYQRLTPLSGLPVYGQYIKDGEQLLAAGDYGIAAAETTINALLPYADLLGFSGQESFAGGTAEDRVKMIIETVDKVAPQLDAISQNLTQTQAVFNNLDNSHYPTRLGDLFAFKVASLFQKNLVQYQDLNLREQIGSVKTTVDELSTAFYDYRPVIEKLPQLLGGKGQRMKYLVLFQNDNELRPTGGFLTAYSIIYVEDGKIVPDKSDDIYELDKKFSKKLPIPAELGKYLTTEKEWHLRDMNINPDFKLSMDTFLENYKTVKGEPQDIDGIIAIDTKVLTDLIDTLGPVEVEGYGTFTTEPDKKYTDAPQIVIALSEIITRPTPYIRTDRKGILGPMMKAVLQKTYSAGSEQFPKLFNLAIDNIEGRHIQAYFMNPEMQEVVEKINMAGRMIAPDDGADFFSAIDANLGGAKSNLFITSSVVHEVEAPENGMLNKRVTMTYFNSRPGDNCNLEAGLLCLNSTNNDWQRVYLPAGTVLNSAQGFKSEPTVYSENGFTVIDGFFSLQPNSSSKLILDYSIPYTYADGQTYKAHIWKQGGVNAVDHLFNVNGNEEKITVTKDIVFQAPFN